MLLNLSLELVNDLLFLVHTLRQLSIIIADLACLLLNDHTLVLQSVKLRVLALELLLNSLLFQLKCTNLIVQLIQFNLLPLYLLIIISKLFLTLFFLPLGLLKLMLCVKQVILGLTKRFLGHPALPFLVCLLSDEVLELGTLVVQLLLHLAVSTADPIDLLLKHLTLVCLVLDAPFHLVDLCLSLAHLILHLLHLLC